jgi:hypothetical protein
MRVTIPQRIEGHRFDNVPNNDLEQKLTYQQLLNMNHDLAKENMILKTHCIFCHNCSKKTWLRT